MTINGIEIQGILDLFLSIFAVGAIIAVIFCLILLSGFILCYSISLWISAKWVDIEGRSYGKSFLSALLLCAAWGLVGFLGFFFNEYIVAICSLLFCPIFLIKFVYECPFIKAVLAHYASMLVLVILSFIFILAVVLILSFFQLGKNKADKHENQVAVTLKTEPADPTKTKPVVEGVPSVQEGAKVPVGILPDIKEAPKRNTAPVTLVAKPTNPKKQLPANSKVPPAKANATTRKPVVIQIKTKKNHTKTKIIPKNK